jgi:ATP-dependent protease ClpP protease subunit
LVYLQGESLTKEDFNSALETVLSGDTVVKIDSLGGDFRSAISFVKEIKKNPNLEAHLLLEIHTAASSAAYVVFSLNCAKQMHSNGNFIIHGGFVSAEANELFDGGGCKDSKEFYLANKNFIAENFPEKLDFFVATNEVRFSAQECLKQGVVHELITNKRH